MASSPVIHRMAGHRNVGIPYRTIRNDLHITAEWAASRSTQCLSQGYGKVQRDRDMRRRAPGHHRDPAAGIFILFGLVAFPRQKLIERHQFFGIVRHIPDYSSNGLVSKPTGSIKHPRALAVAAMRWMTARRETEISPCSNGMIVEQLAAPGERQTASRPLGRP